MCHVVGMTRTEKANIHLLALISNGALAGDQLPTELKLLEAGANQTRKGVVTVGQKTRTMLPRLQSERGFDRVSLDFEHNTVAGTKAYKESSEPRPVAAFGIPQLREDGLFLTSLVWTPEGQKSARNYIDLSPAPELDANGEVIFLHSVALCRQGAVDGLSFFSVEVNTPQNTAEDQTMEKILSALRKGLGLAETATEEDIQKALTPLTALVVKLDDLDKKVSAFSVQGSTERNLELVTLTATVTELAGKVATFNAEIERRDRAELVAQACREGKVIPFSTEQVNATPVATLRDMVKNLVATVPIENRTPIHVQEFSVSGDQVMTDQDKKLAAKLGFSEEDVKKANGLK